MNATNTGRDFPGTGIRIWYQEKYPAVDAPIPVARYEEEMDALRRDRQREDVRNQAEALQAQQSRETNIRQRRAEGGSRFNIRYTPSVPLEAVTPEAVMRALELYVDFSSLVGVQSSPVREN